MEKTAQINRLKNIINSGGNAGNEIEDDAARKTAATAQATADSKLSSIAAKNSQTVTFFGTGTADNPLAAVSNDFNGNIGINGGYNQAVGFDKDNKIVAVDVVTLGWSSIDINNSSGQWQLGNGSNGGINDRPYSMVSRGGLGYIGNGKITISTQTGDPATEIDSNGNLNVTIPPTGITADNAPADGQILTAKSNGAGGISYQWANLPNKA